MQQINIIGKVQNRWEEATPRQADQIMEEVSIIEVDETYKEGLFKIDLYKELLILFYFDRTKEDFPLKVHTRSGEYRGVFASHSPNRPSLIGLTRVNLLECKDNKLWVTGLDALNNTPVLDIKPVIESRKE